VRRRAARAGAPGSRARTDRGCRRIDEARRSARRGLGVRPPACRCQQRRGADREGLPLADAGPVAILRRTGEGVEGERAEVALFVIPGRGNAASPEPMNTGFPGHAHWAWVP